MIQLSTASVRLRALAGLGLVAGLVLAALPMVAATPSTGAWIFPHAKQMDAVGDALDDTFYIADSENPWLQDSYFTDSLSDGATVAVDLYNPTGSDFYNVQVFAAYSLENLDLVESISFSGGVGGDVSFSGTDLESGGTPQMTGGVAIDDHDVYPAYFVSYSVGDLAAGTGGILTFTVDIVGDFANGLIVHLDYTAEDADGNGVSGPFEADMNIFENGEAPGCVDPQVGMTLSVLTHSPNGTLNLTGIAFLVTDDPTATARMTVTLDMATMVDAGPFTPTGNPREFEWVHAPGAFRTGLTLLVAESSMLLAGDPLTVTSTISTTGCDGASIVASEALDHVARGPASGAAVHSAEWWAQQAKKVDAGQGSAAFTRTEFAILLQRAAFHSAVFAFASWNGTPPDGGSDEGWVDIDSAADARDVLEKHTGESGKVRGSEREDLALWLNVASGALNLDTPLKVVPKKDGKHSEFEAQTGLSTLPSAYDTPGEILGLLERQVKDWQDGHGDSKAALKLARRLARCVNNEWLVAA